MSNRLFAVKVSCPALFTAVETIATEAGYCWKETYCINVNNSYIGFQDNKIMDTGGNKTCLSYYTNIYDASTEFEKIRKLLIPERIWNINNNVIIKLIDGKLYINCLEVSRNIVEEIYDRMIVQGHE